MTQTNTKIKQAVYQKNYRQKNLEEIREYQRTYHRRYRILHRDKTSKLIKSWRKRNPERAKLLNRLHTQTYRSRKSATRLVARINKKQIINWESRICGICGILIIGEFHIDHIIPLSKEGPHQVSNLQLAHPFCNRSKSGKLLEKFNIMI